MTITCPCCGQAITAPRAPIEALRDAPVQSKMRRIVDALATAYPRSLSTAALIDVCYGDDPSGGPDNAVGNLAVFINRLRRKLPEYGWTIPKNDGGRGVRGRYRLSPIMEGDS